MHRVNGHFALGGVHFVRLGRFGLAGPACQSRGGRAGMLGIRRTDGRLARLGRSDHKNTSPR